MHALLYTKSTPQPFLGCGMLVWDPSHSMHLLTYMPPATPHLTPQPYPPCTSLTTTLHPLHPPPYTRFNMFSLYKLRVQTLDSRGAGTFSPVSVVLLGDKGPSREVLLEGGSDCFSRGKVRGRRGGGRGRSGRKGERGVPRGRSGVVQLEGGKKHFVV